MRRFSLPLAALSAALGILLVATGLLRGSPLISAGIVVGVLLLANAALRIWAARAR